MSENQFCRVEILDIAYKYAIIGLQVEMHNENFEICILNMGTVSEVHPRVGLIRVRVRVRVRVWVRVSG